ncbi:Hypothetical predicted protein, partial [Paramuricea clavata]
MFLNIEMVEKHRDFLRFLWHEDCDATKDPSVYHFNTLIFGQTDGPFTAIYTLQRHAKEMLESSTNPLTQRACNILLRDTYVDDITSGADSVDDALALQEELMRILETAGFKAKKWCSNSNKFLQGLNPAERAPTTIRPLGGTEELEQTEEIFVQTKTLGISWDPETDLFVYNNHDRLAEENLDTKRSVASLMAK